MQPERMKRSREPEDDEVYSSPEPEVVSDKPSSSSSDGARSPREVAGLPRTKITELDESALDTGNTFAMRCSLPPHREVLSFRTYAEYESHHNRTHTNRCVECGKNFPSDHLLNVHIEECHDIFAAVKREKGEHTYSCFVEGCDRKCRTPQKRRSHLIDKHMYPKNYFFAVTKEGVDGRQSLLIESGHRRRRSSATTNAGGPKTSEAEAPKLGTDKSKTQAPAEAASSPAEVPDTQMDDLAGAMSALQFVPTSVRFGHRKGKTGFAKR